MFLLPAESPLSSERLSRKCMESLDLHRPSRTIRAVDKPPVNRKPAYCCELADHPQAVGGGQLCPLRERVEPAEVGGKARTRTHVSMRRCALRRVRLSPN